MLADEVYHHAVFSPTAVFTHVAGATSVLRDRTLSIFSAGKSFSCTGFRLGFILGPTQLINPCRYIRPKTRMSPPLHLPSAVCIPAKVPNHVRVYAHALTRFPGSQNGAHGNQFRPCDTNAERHRLGLSRRCCQSVSLTQIISTGSQLCSCTQFKPYPAHHQQVC